MAEREFDPNEAPSGASKEPGRWFRRILRSAAWLLLLIGLLLVTDVAMACPNCKDSLAQNDPARSGLSRGFYWSILLMLSTPFVVTAGLGTYFYLLVRKARRAAPQVPSWQIHERLSSAG